MIDVRRLRILREVAVAGTVTAAARALGYTPSAVSQQLAALERETGSELLRRRGRGIELTAEGRLLVAVAERVGAELEAAEAELAVRAARPGGVVRLLAFATALQTLVPRAAAALAASAPELTLEIDEADPDDALRLLVQERADVVVAHDYDLLERRRHARVHRRELLADELRVVGAADAKRGAPDAKRGAAGAKSGAPGALDLATLAERAWVLPDRGSACDRVVERACAAAGFAPRVVARSSDFAAIAALAEACGAVALVPRLSLERTAPTAAGAAAARPLATPVRRLVFAAVRDGAQRRPLEAAVLDALTDATAAPA
ncbi:LysR substrate-binding domain-containing protein [Conexibacter stalactiti]|uniref:LysR substrate-binding domain-containing protein n=1 Tax=Conexibacter stalactiti TaxID=1940611 RepID=A0ABU4HZI7_9ACTN|nr:LysR substrate-binding domain-containing protein [Conexibacter stalactiti]MDW5598705.1 LysR substrate-binding domain-containing protein [Conexibacter stalactiti]MEC5039347.1 LysR substrate-binding domain-containing protein [Conexibacter stalactiti]